MQISLRLNFIIIVSILTLNSSLAQNYNEDIRINNSDSNYGSGKKIIFGHSQDGSNAPMAALKSFLVDGSGNRSGKLIFQTSYAGTLYDRMLIHESGNVELRNGINLLNSSVNYGSGQQFVFGHSQDGSNAPMAALKSFLVDGSVNRSGKLIFQTSYAGTLHDRMVINENGSIGIATSQTGPHMLAVYGSIGAREIKVEMTEWQDRVFYEDYDLRTLEEVEEHINEEGHLPEIPSEAEVTENGINLGEMDAKLLQKIEELTLYLIEQNKEIKQLKEEIKQLKDSK